MMLDVVQNFHTHTHPNLYCREEKKKKKNNLQYPTWKIKQVGINQSQLVNSLAVLLRLGLWVGMRVGLHLLGVPFGLPLGPGLSMEKRAPRFFFFFSFSFLFYLKRAPGAATIYRSPERQPTTLQLFAMMMMMMMSQHRRHALCVLRNP